MVLSGGAGKGRYVVMVQSGGGYVVMAKVVAATIGKERSSTLTFVSS